MCSATVLFTNLRSLLVKGMSLRAAVVNIYTLLLITINSHLSTTGRYIMSLLVNH